MARTSSENPAVIFRRDRRWHADALGAAFSMIASTILAFMATGLRPGIMHRPMAGGDLFGTYAVVRGQMDHGWYLRNSDLGWPFGQDLRLYPMFDQTHFAALKVLALGSSDPILVTNAYYLLGFPLAAATSYLFFRLVRMQLWFAAPLAVSYAILPWHTQRVGAFFLASYWVVPLGMALVYVVATGSWDITLRRLSVRQRRALTFAGCLAAVVVALGGIYYAIMLSVLITLAFALRGFGRAVWLGPSAWLVGWLGGTTAVSMIVAKIMTAAASGPQDAGGAFTRYVSESEIYGGRIISLLVPWPGTPVLGALRVRYDAGSQIGNPSPWHGIVAVGGTWLLLGYVGALLLRSGSRERAVRVSGPFPWLAGMTLLLVLTYVTTGFGGLVALAGLPELRAWERFSIFIALLATAAVGLALQCAIARLSQRLGGWQTMLTVTASGLVGLVVLVDQGSPVASYLATPQLEERLLATRTAMAAVDQVVTPTHCPVFQFPEIRFPEIVPTGRVGDYDQLLPYLAGAGRPWSFGGIKGSLAGEWTSQLDDSSAEHLTAQIASSDFCVLEVLDGALVDTQDISVAARLPVLLGSPVAHDAVNERSYYDLRGLRKRLTATVGQSGLARLRDGALFPVMLRPDPGTVAPFQGEPGKELAWTTNRTAYVDVVNPSRRARQVSVTTVLTSPAAPLGEAVRFGNRKMKVGPIGRKVTLTVDVAGRQTRRLPITVRSTGQDDPARIQFLQMGVPSASYDRGPLPAPPITNGAPASP